MPSHGDELGATGNSKVYHADPRVQTTPRVRSGSAVERQPRALRCAPARGASAKKPAGRNPGRLRPANGNPYFGFGPLPVLPLTTLLTVSVLFPTFGSNVLLVTEAVWSNEPTEPLT